MVTAARTTRDEAKGEKDKEGRGIEKGKDTMLELEGRLKFYLHACILWINTSICSSDN